MQVFLDKYKMIELINCGNWGVLTQYWKVLNNNKSPKPEAALDDLFSFFKDTRN